MAPRQSPAGRRGPAGDAVPRIRPRRLPEPSVAALAARGLQIAGSVVRNFAPLVVRQLHEFRAGRLPASAIAHPLRLTFEELGGTFIKFGQIMASSPGMFGEDVADEFRPTLDTGPPADFQLVRQVIEDDLGMSLAEAFAELDPEPIGRASIAVVYRARMHDGREVAVKVLRPGIERLVATDLDLMQPFFELLARETGEVMAGSTLQLLDGFRVQIGEEMDLRNEARSLAHFRRLWSLKWLPLVVVPEPFPELSGQNVLTMEYLDGVPIDDFARVAEMGVDPRPLIEQVVRVFFLTTVKWGVFHGDIHAGNMMLLRDGRIGVIDWGIVGRLDADTHHFLLRLLAAALGDESGWIDASAHITRTYGPAIKEAVGMSDQGLARFIRSLVEPALTRPFGEVSLASVFQATQLQVAKAQGIEAHQRSVRAVVHRLRAQRRLRRMADEAGGFMSDFDRGAFLLGKQLMYFERYGRMFMHDVPLLNDRAFLAELLADADADGAGAGPGRGGRGPVC